jgi:hypothetical protein
MPPIARAIPRQPPHGRQVIEGANRDGQLVSEAGIDSQRLFLGPGRAGIVPGHLLDGRQVAEGVGLAEPVAEVTVDARRFF